MSSRPSLADSLLNGGSVRPLEEHDPGTLQVLLSGLGLSRHGEGLVLDVSVTSDTPAIRGRAGKGVLAAAVERGGGGAERRLREELAGFEASSTPDPRRFECPGHPLRWANAGVLPILRIGGREHFALFLREIPPIGWNLANGASDDPDDLRDPGRIAVRELAEELLLWSPGLSTVFDLVATPEARATDDGVCAWMDRQPDLEGVSRRRLPADWIDGPDRVRAQVLGRTLETGGWFLAITPEDNAIEVDRVVRIDAPDDVRLLDGELTPGGLLDRVVGLFPVEPTLGAVARDPEGPVLPTRVFRSGVEREPALLDALVEEYFEDLAARGLGTEDERRAHARLGPLECFRLCPVARSLIARGPYS